MVSLSSSTTLLSSSLFLSMMGIGMVNDNGYRVSLTLGSTSDNNAAAVLVVETTGNLAMVSVLVVRMLEEECILIVVNAVVVFVVADPPINTKGMILIDDFIMTDFILLFNRYGVWPRRYNFSYNVYLC